MKIKRLIGGNLESNGYILYDREGGSCFIVDPGYHPDHFLKKVKELRLSVQGILLTHHHYDHVGGVDKIVGATGCKVYLHRGDVDIYKNRVDVALEDGNILMLGDEEILVVHTPGHTKGGVCYYSEKSKLAFTGDTIFNVDLGRTDLKDGEEQEMICSVRDIINQWTNEIVIYPGHGDPCNMKYVRKYNREFLEIVK